MNPDFPLGPPEERDNNEWEYTYQRFVDTFVRSYRSPIVSAETTQPQNPVNTQETDSEGLDDDALTRLGINTTTPNEERVVSNDDRDTRLGVFTTENIGTLGTFGFQGAAGNVGFQGATTTVMRTDEMHVNSESLTINGENIEGMVRRVIREEIANTQNHELRMLVGNIITEELNSWRNPGLRNAVENVIYSNTYDSGVLGTRIREVSREEIQLDKQTTRREEQEHG